MRVQAHRFFHQRQGLGRLPRQVQRAGKGDVAVGVVGVHCYGALAFRDRFVIPAPLSKHAGGYLQGERCRLVHRHGQIFFGTEKQVVQRD